MSELKVKKAQSGRILGIVLIGAGACMGGMFFLMFGKMRSVHEQSAKWPEVQGKIVSSTISEKEKMNRIGRRGLAVITEYVHEKKIAYVVNGKTYTKSTSWTYASESEANKFKKREKVGTPVRLHYNPARPQVADFHREGGGANPIMGLVFGGFIAVPGLFLFWWNSRKLRNLMAASQSGPVVQQAEPQPAAVMAVPKQAPGIELESMKYFDMMSK